MLFLAFHSPFLSSADPHEYWSLFLFVWTDVTVLKENDCIEVEAEEARNDVEIVQHRTE
jgi:hypothetical protein